MILIGQYDSPFVRRVAVALRLYGLAYGHRPWSTFGDGDRLAAFNPLRRVPTLVLDHGEVLIDSAAILDHLDEVAGPARALLPESGAARRAGLRVVALGTGLADKAVSLVYERLLHDEVSAAWEARCRTQIEAVLAVLEDERMAATGPWWFGTAIGHGDIAVACVLRFLAEAHPALFDPAKWPALAAHAARAEALDAFAGVVQAFIPPR